MQRTMRKLHKLSVGIRGHARRAAVLLELAVRRKEHAVDERCYCENSSDDSTSSTQGSVNK